VNAVQQRLILAREAGDSGWFGAWAKMAFTVDANGILVTPRYVARLEQIAVCNRAIKVQNAFFEFLDYGIGLQPQPVCNYLQAYERDSVPTFSDLVPPNKKVRVYVTDATDVGKRVLIQGTDQNGNTIYSLDSLVQITGTFVALDAPFADTDMVINSISGIQKDVTNGTVNFFEVDTVAGVERLILSMEPGEKVASYRKYLINGIPNQCGCNGCGNPFLVSAMVKLEFIPVAVDTDWLAIPNLEAITEEAQSMRYSTMDSPSGAQLAVKHHTDAIRLLQGQLVHYLGKNRPAISFYPFGSAKLERQQIGSML